MSNATHTFKTGDRVWVYRNLLDGHPAEVVRTTATQVTVRSRNGEQRFSCSDATGRLIGEIRARYHLDTKIMPFTEQHVSILTARKWRNELLELEQVISVIRQEMPAAHKLDRDSVQVAMDDAVAAIARLRCVVCGPETREASDEI